MLSVDPLEQSVQPDGLLVYRAAPSTMVPTIHVEPVEAVTEQQALDVHARNIPQEF